MSDNNKPKPPENLARPDMAEKPTVILGGGPAGLTAGYLLSK
jgi:ribulose 1,5-bisphosphate synthetase/thiazole synthase